MICRYCGGKIIYTQVRKEIKESYKSFLISDDGNLQPIKNENDITETFEEDYAACEKCGCSYYYEKINDKLLINDIIEKRLKNTIFNYIIKCYGDYSKSNLSKFITDNCLSETEILNYIKKDYPLSEATISKLILIFQPSQEIIDYWIKFYT